MDVDSTTTPLTNAGEPLALEEGVTCGSKSWGELQRDKNPYGHNPSFPETSPARTTFYAEDAPDDSPMRWNQFWRLQHGRGHTYENWDGQRIRTEDRFNHQRACVILSRAHVKGIHRDEALRRVMAENLNGFSRHYDGVWGAALGFAALSRFSNRENAKSSHIVDMADEVIGINGEALIDYVWRTYEGGQ